MILKSTEPISRPEQMTTMRVERISFSTANKARTGAVYEIAGRTEEAKQILRECEEASAHEPAEDVNQWGLALIHMKLGNKDRALEWIEKMFEPRTVTPFEIKYFRSMTKSLLIRGSKS